MSAVGTFNDIFKVGGDNAPQNDLAANVGGGVILRF